MSTNSFEINNYRIILSLGERAIYVKFTDQVNFTTYESNLDAKELQLNFKLLDIYKLICETFDKGYNYTISINNGHMKLIFNLLVGGILNVNFEAILKEKIMSNDGQLTMNINKMEQRLLKLEDKICKLEKELEDKTEALGYAEIMGFPINSKYILLPESKNSGDFMNTLEKLKYFYRLEDLTIHSNTTRHDLHYLTKNSSLKKLFYYGILHDINGIENFPKITELKIQGSNHELSANTVINVLKNKTHKIKKLIFVGFPSIKANAIDLQTYCLQNNIELTIS